MQDGHHVVLYNALHMLQEECCIAYLAINTLGLPLKQGELMKVWEHELHFDLFGFWHLSVH